MMKGGWVTSPSHLLIVITILLIYCHLPLSSSSRECYNCRSKECRGEDEGIVEQCVGRANTCAMWIWRRDKPKEDIKAGDVYKKECTELLVATEGCKEIGLYIRCLCKGHLCNVRSLVQIKDAKSGTTSQNPTTTTNKTTTISTTKTPTTTEVIMTTNEETTTKSEVNDTMTSEMPASHDFPSSTKKPKKKTKTKVPANSTGTVLIGKSKSTKETNVSAQSYNFTQKESDKHTEGGDNGTESQRSRETNVQHSSYSYSSRDEKEGKYIHYDTREKGDREKAAAQDNLQPAETTTTTTELPVPVEEEGEEDTEEVKEHHEETEKEKDGNGDKLRIHFKRKINNRNASFRDNFKPRKLDLEISI